MLVAQTPALAGVWAVGIEMATSRKRRCRTPHGRVLVQREGADTRVLAVGGVTGGLPPVHIRIGLMSVWSSKARCCAFVLTKAGGIGGRHAPEMPAVCDPKSPRPNVRAKRATAAGRQARAGENVPRTARPGLVACRWRSA